MHLTSIPTDRPISPPTYLPVSLCRTRKPTTVMDTFNLEDYELTNVSYPKSRLKNIVIWEATLKIIFYTLVIIFSLVGNVLIIVIVARQKRMRTVTNFYMVNLAVADLLVTLCCSWVHLVDDLTEGWVLGAFFCKINSFAQDFFTAIVLMTFPLHRLHEFKRSTRLEIVSLVASVFTLSLIALDRFYGIVFALKAHITERSAQKSLLFVWLCAVAVGSPILVYRNLYTTEWRDHVEKWCNDKWPNPGGANLQYPTIRRIYYTFVATVLYIIPMLVMTLAYSIVIWKLKSSAIPGETIEREVAMQARIKRKVVIMLIAILFVFGICWLPYVISLLYAEHKTTLMLNDWFYDLMFCAQYLADSNAALNPIIYVGFNENFRQGLRDMLRCFKKRNPELIMLGRNDSAYQSTSVTKL